MQEDEQRTLPCHDKIAFTTKKEAQATATVAAYRYGSDVRPYNCRHCGLWHLATTIKT